MSSVLPAPVSLRRARGSGALRTLFSFPALLAAFLVALAFLSARSRFNDPDMWWHLRTGQIIWTSHSIPTTDLYSYTTHHHAWVPHEWLSQLSIYLSYRLAGYTGLMLWLCLLTAALLVASYVLCSLYSGNSKTAILGALAIWFFSTIGLAVRPQMIGYLLLVCELLLLHLGRTRNPRWFYALPPLFALWVNCHGSFSLGLMVMLILLACSVLNVRWGLIVSSRWDKQRVRTLSIAFLLSVAALFVNPVGIRQVLYPLNLWLYQPANLAHVQEWMPLTITSARGIGVCLVLLCIALIALVRGAELHLEELLLVALGTWLAAGHARMAFVFGILVAPVLARLLAPLWESYDPERDHPWANAILLAVSLLAAWIAFPSRASLNADVRSGNPVAAVQFIKDHQLSGNMLNGYVFGGYLIWALPEYPVFIDGRADIFDWTGVFSEYARWAELQQDPRALLDKYHISFCLLERSSPMARVLTLLPGWKQVYADNEAVIFIRA